MRISPPSDPLRSRNRTASTVLIAPTLFALAILIGGCSPSDPARQPASAPAETSAIGEETEESVIIYCSIDREFAEPILSDFENRTGIRVHRQYDTEAGKTTGLVNRLLAERETPRADVWWSSEIFGTIQLAEQGVLAPYAPKSAKDMPARYHDSENRWTAFGLRGRVIAYDPERVKPGDLPRRWADLALPRYKGRLAMADPRFGTTRGHMATLFKLWGENSLSKWYEALRLNEFRRADGNSHAVLLVTRGAVDFAATDTDDVIVAQSRGDSIALCYPDLTPPSGAPEIPGTLWIPCSAALVKGARHPNAARRLLDEIASAETERELAMSDSRNVPVRRSVLEALNTQPGGPPFAKAFLNPDDIQADGTIKPFPYEAPVDYAEAAAALKASDRLVVDVLLR